MMLTPCWPSAGPTGGAGFACPPGIWSLMMCQNLLSHLRFLSRSLLDLVESELDRHLPLEDVDHHLKLLRVGVDVDDLAVEIRERAGRDLDRLAERELDLGARRARRRRRPCAGSGRPRGCESGTGLVPAPTKPGHARRVLDDRPRVVVEVHVHEHVARQHALLGLDLLAVLRLDHLLGRDDDATEPRRCPIDSIRCSRLALTFSRARNRC